MSNLNFLDLLNKHRQLKNDFYIAEQAIIEYMKQVLIPTLIDLVKQLTSIKSVVWTQYCKWDGGMPFDFEVKTPVFFSFVPTEVQEYYDYCEEPLKENDFIISGYNLENSEKISEEDKKICQQISSILYDNNTLFEEVFGDNQWLCLTSEGIENYHYIG